MSELGNASGAALELNLGLPNSEQRARASEIHRLLSNESPNLPSYQSVSVSVSHTRATDPTYESHSSHE